MNDNNYEDDKDRNVDADTTLDELDTSRLNNIHDNVSTGTTRPDDGNEPSIFGANNLLRKTEDNLVRSEAMVDEKPLRTDVTTRLEQARDRDKSQ